MLSCRSDTCLASKFSNAGGTVADVISLDGRLASLEIEVRNLQQDVTRAFELIRDLSAAYEETNADRQCAASIGSSSDGPIGRHLQASLAGALASARLRARGAAELAAERALAEVMHELDRTWVLGSEAAALKASIEEAMCLSSPVAAKAEVAGNAIGAASEEEPMSPTTPKNDDHLSSFTSLGSHEVVGDNLQVGDIAFLGHGVPAQYQRHAGVIMKVEEAHCLVVVLDEKQRVGIGQCWPSLADLSVQSRRLRLMARVVISGFSGAHNMHFNGLSGTIVAHPREGHPTFICKSSCPERPRFTVCVRFDDPVVAGERTALLEPRFLSPYDGSANPDVPPVGSSSLQSSLSSLRSLDKTFGSSNQSPQPGSKSDRCIGSARLVAVRPATEMNVKETSPCKETSLHSPCAFAYAADDAVTQDVLDSAEDVDSDRLSLQESPARSHTSMPIDKEEHTNGVWKHTLLEGPEEIVKMSCTPAKVSPPPYTLPIMEAGHLRNVGRHASQEESESVAQQPCTPLLQPAVAPQSVVLQAGGSADYCGSQRHSFVTDETDTHCPLDGSTDGGTPLNCMDTLQPVELQNRFNEIGFELAAAQAPASFGHQLRAGHKQTAKVQEVEEGVQQAASKAQQSSEQRTVQMSQLAGSVMPNRLLRAGPARRSTSPVNHYASASSPPLGLVCTPPPSCSHPFSASTPAQDATAASRPERVAISRSQSLPGLRPLTVGHSCSLGSSAVPCSVEFGGSLLVSSPSRTVPLSLLSEHRNPKDSPIKRWQPVHHSAGSLRIGSVASSGSQTPISAQTNSFITNCVPKQAGGHFTVFESKPELALRMPSRVSGNLTNSQQISAREPVPLQASWRPPPPVVRLASAPATAFQM